MQICRRLSYAAIVGCLIAATLLSPVLALGQPQGGNADNTGQYTEPTTDPEKAKAAFDAWFWREAKGDPETYRSICEHPADRDYASLCQQWRSAEAADQQLYWAEKQYGISWASTAGLMFTLIFTGWAALAASRAANAAKDQTKIIRKEFYATHRPRLIVRQALSQITDWEEQRIKIQYTITNVGDSECWITHAHIGIQFILFDGYPDVQLPPQIEFADNVPHVGRIAPGQTINCGYTDPNQSWDLEHRQNRPGEAGVFFVGNITYLDHQESGISRQMGFRRKYNIEAQRFVRINPENPEDEFAD